jgi:hypothetical protein
LNCASGGGVSGLVVVRLGSARGFAALARLGTAGSADAPGSAGARLARGPAFAARGSARRGGRAPPPLGGRGPRSRSPGDQPGRFDAEGAGQGGNVVNRQRGSARELAGEARWLEACEARCLVGGEPGRGDALGSLGGAG